MTKTQIAKYEEKVVNMATEELTKEIKALADSIVRNDSDLTKPQVRMWGEMLVIATDFLKARNF